MAERQQRVLQRKVPGRVPIDGVVQEQNRCQDRDRGISASVQRSPASLEFGTTDTGRVQTTTWNDFAMDDEFKRTGVNTAVSSGGFTVETRFAEVVYDDAAGHVEIYAEWGGTPTEVILYKRSLKGMSTSRVDTVLSNVTRALKYLGHGVEVSSDQ